MKTFKTYLVEKRLPDIALYKPNEGVTGKFLANPCIFVKIKGSRGYIKYNKKFEYNKETEQWEPTNLGHHYAAHDINRMGTLTPLSRNQYEEMALLELN